MGSPPVQGSPVSAAAHGWGKARPERDQGGLRRQQSGPEKPQRCTHMSQSAAATHPSLLRPEPPTETLPLTQAPGPSKLWPSAAFPLRHGDTAPAHSRRQAGRHHCSSLLSALARVMGGRVTTSSTYSQMVQKTTTCAPAYIHMCTRTHMPSGRGEWG